MKSKKMIPLVIFTIIVIPVLIGSLIYYFDARESKKLNNDINLSEKENEIIEHFENLDKTNEEATNDVENSIDESNLDEQIDVEKPNKVDETKDEVINNTNSSSTKDSDNSKNENNSSINEGNKIQTDENISLPENNQVPQEEIVSPPKESQESQQEDISSSKEDLIEENAQKQPETSNENNNETENDTEYLELKKSTYPTYQECYQKGIEVVMDLKLSSVVERIYCQEVGYKNEIIGFQLYFKYTTGEFVPYK